MGGKKRKPEAWAGAPLLDQGGASALFRGPGSHPRPVIRVELVNTAFPVPSCSPRGKQPGIELCAVSSHQVSLLQSGVIILIHKKEQNWVICRQVDGPRLCHTEWRKSEREKQILYMKAYM